jgi:DNA segregation ATPase FtsK/SpoIIIE, S-DNA-T family
MIKLPSFKEAKINIDEQTRLTLGILVCFGLALITYVSILGFSTARIPSSMGIFLRTLLGRGSFMIPIFFLIGAYILIKAQAKKAFVQGLTPRLFWGLGIMLVALVGLISANFKVTNVSDISLNDKQGLAGGFIGFIISYTLLMIVGDIGSYVVLFSLFVMGIFVLTGVTFVEFLNGCADIIRNPKLIWDKIPNLFEFLDKDEVFAEIETNESARPMDSVKSYSSAVHTKAKVEDEPTSEYIIKDDLIDIEPKEVKTKRVFSFNGGEGKIKEMVAEQVRIEESETEEGRDYDYPRFDLLSDKKSKSDAGDIEGNKTVIKNTLNHFGITVTMADVAIGPTVSQYSLQPAEGVRLSSIDALQRDLALALAARNIRIESPIPGKKLVGIEIPNVKKEMVRIRDIFDTKEFINFPDDLPIAIGKDVTGQNNIYPLSKMPHLLVAGATGSGKSVWINGLLLSLVYRYAPKDLALILVDMKRVELKFYDGIPHLKYPVITDSEKAINALKWTVLEMDKRYKFLEESSKRNIKDYNKYAKTYGKEPMKYIVFVIDELGDLMMLAKNEVEPIVVRLTQMSRAVGIHLVLGTQRPDTQVVTGLIKANIPTRISFAVASQIDSRVILDQVGAEKLLGQGDGLIVTPSSLGARRFQGANVEENEVRKVVQFLKDQVHDIIEDTNYDESVGQKPTSKINVPGMQMGKNEPMFDDEGNQMDSSYEQAKKLVIQYQKASTSFLQNRMGIGYPKAAKIIMQLEENSIVGPANGSKPRDVYLQEETDDE